jgi:HNH endonuclease
MTYDAVVTKAKHPSERRKPGPRPIPLLDRVFRSVAYDHGCWTARWSLNQFGYSQINDRRERRSYMGHRLVYEAMVGPLNGLDLDHLCRNRARVNPLHLEPVTKSENIRRGIAGKRERERTHCPAGHEYSHENTIRAVTRPGASPQRMCRACADRRKREYKARKRRQTRSSA